MLQHNRLAILFLIVGFALMPLSVPSVVVAQTIKLRLSSQLPATSMQAQGLRAFRDEVAARTGGAIDIELLEGERALSDQKLGAEVAAGRIEMGLVNVSTLATSVPAIEFIEQPFLLNFDALVRAVTDPARPVRPLLDGALLEKAGVRSLLWVPYGLNVLFSKGTDATSPIALAGRRVRTFSEASGAFLRACGISSVIVPASRQLEALSKGEVDFVMTGLAGVRVRNLWQAADTITLTGNSPVEFPVIVHEETWQRLPGEHRKTIQDVAGEIEQKMREAFPAAEQAEMEFARGKGMRIIALTSEQVADWRACSWPVSEGFLDRVGPIGQDLMAAYAQIRLDPCCTSNPGATASAPPGAKLD